LDRFQGSLDRNSAPLDRLHPVTRSIFRTCTARNACYVARFQDTLARNPDSHARLCANLARNPWDVARLCATLARNPPIVARFHGGAAAKSRNSQSSPCLIEWPPPIPQKQQES